MNNLFLNTLDGSNQSNKTPVWLMRQAGRYMPEYRALRSRHGFLEMCHQPELAATITQLPVKVFDFDAAILFSDILVVAEAFKVGLKFDDGIGPIIERPLSTEKDVDQLRVPDILQSLHYVSEAIKLLKQQLKVPLIGFCGAPFTVASYMIEGKSSRDLKKTKQWMLCNPVSFHKLLTKIADATVDYLNMQIDAGVDAIQIFDSWAHVLAFSQFQEFSKSYMERLMKGLKNRNIPVILFCRGSSVFAESMAELNPAGISVDWNCNLMQLRSKIPSHIAMQGNLDPDILYAPYSVIKEETNRLLVGMKNDPRYIFNLGHGIFPDIPVDSVRFLVECIKGI